MKTKVSRRKVACLLILSLMVVMIQLPTYAMANVANNSYYDAELININEWYNMGLNANMTGGTAGRIYVGEKFIILGTDPANNSYGYSYYVYAINAGIYGYVSPYYVRVLNGPVVYDAELININEWYNMGLNANMTGGTAGRIYVGEKFIILGTEAANNSYGYSYYVYAINAGIYGYVSPYYVRLV